MSKRDLLYVLVIYAGFSSLIFAAVFSGSTLLSSIIYAVQAKSFQSGIYHSLLDLVIRILISVVVIRKADRITSWLLREPKT